MAQTIVHDGNIGLELGGSSGSGIDPVVDQVQLLATVTGIDLEALAETALYTPTTDILVNSVHVRVTATTSVTTVPTIQIESGSAILWGPDLCRGLTALDHTYVFAAGAHGLFVPSAGGPIKLEVTVVGADSGAYTATAYLLGLAL